MNKVTCDWVQTHLIAYLKNGLSAAERTALAEHLTTCDVCAQAVQEAKTLEADLLASAGQNRPKLSQEASLRIQKQVYRRMRRALVVQRTVALFQMAGAVVTSILLLGGALLFGNQWVAFLSNPSAIGGEQPTTFTQSQTSSAAIATAVPPITPAPTPAEELISTTPGATPEEITRTFMHAALTQNSEQMAELLGVMRSNKEPTLRMWRNFGQRCGEVLTADSLQYEAIPLRPGITARVEMYQNGRFIGDIKVRLIHNDWFIFFAPIPSVNNCQFAAGHSPFTVYRS